MYARMSVTLTTVILLFVGGLALAGGLELVRAEPASAGEDTPCARCDQDLGPEPSDDRFAGDVGAQIELLNAGEEGGSSVPPQPCDARLRNEDPGFEYPPDADPADFEGVVRWHYGRNNDSEAQYYDSDGNLREGGTWYERWCDYPDGSSVFYPYTNAGCDYWEGTLCNPDGDVDLTTNCAVDFHCYFDAISPEQLAEYAMYQEFEELIDPPEPHFAPDDMTIVNIDTYLWVTGTRDETSFTTPTISVPGMSLSVAAERDDFVWDMGDGGFARCASTGIANSDDEMGDGSCNYSYSHTSVDEPDERFHGSVQVVWEGHYTGVVNDEDIDEIAIVTEETEFDLAVAEVQAIITD